MAYKLIMKWDIKDGLEQEYFEFFMREWIPGMSRIGLQVVGGWYTVYRQREEIEKIMAEGIAEDKSTMSRIINSSDWRDIQEKLMEYVDNYSQKVVKVTGGLQF